MKKKVMIILAFYLFMSMSYPWQYQIAFLTDQSTFAVEHPSISKAGLQGTIDDTRLRLQAARDDESGTIVINDIISPSYTSLTTTANSSLSEGSDATFTSQTTSAGTGVSEGRVDFLDLKLLKIDDDPTSDSIYSNRYAIKISLPTETSLAGFAVDITPTIREDINFYVKTGLNGAVLTEGLISGYIASSAHTTGQLLYVPFSYCGAATTITLSAGMNYYFILEPTVSTSNTFFEFHQSADNPDNMAVYNWWNSNYEPVYTDVNFYLLTNVSAITENVPVNSVGVASTTWIASNQGNHTVLAWYERSTFYGESYGTIELIVCPSQDPYQVFFEPIRADYLDETSVTATVLELTYNPAVGKTVFYSISLDGGANWELIGSALTNASGVSVLLHQFDQAPGNYSLKAWVNDLSYKESYLLLSAKPLSWYGINFIGQYRNNPGAENYTKLTTTVLVLDDENQPVSGLDFELWYKINGTYKHIPHIFTTNSSGQADILHSIDQLEPGFYEASHFFQPLDYVIGYSGGSLFGNTTVAKGELLLEFSNHAGQWHKNLTISARVTSLAEGWMGVLVEFYYLAGTSWSFIAAGLTNNSGFAVVTWPAIPLEAGNYLLRAVVPENALFTAVEENASLIVGRAPITLFLFKNGSLKGNGEIVEVEYLETFHFLFFATYEDGQPATDVIITIKARLLDDFFYTKLGSIVTNGTGFALYSDYHYLDLIGNEYLFRAEIAENSQHEEEVLYFKVLLTKCKPIVYFTDHLCEKGTSTEAVAQFVSIDARAVKNAQVVFIVNGLTFTTRTDRYGFARIIIVPDFSVGQYTFLCQIIEDSFFAAAEKNATLVISKGRPQFTVFAAAAPKDGFLTIRAEAKDLLNRPIANLSVLLTVQSWSQYFLTDANGQIEYTFQVTGLDYGTYLSILTFDGDNNWFSATQTSSVLIYQKESQLTLLTTTLTVTYLDQLVVDGLLTDEFGTPLSNRLIQFFLIYSNGSMLQLGENQTDEHGRVQLTFEIAFIPGSYDINLHYTGAVDFGPANAMTSLLIEQAATKLAGEDVTVIINSTTSFNVTLQSLQGQPIVNQELSVYVWQNGSWLFLGKFQTNYLGICMVGFYVPFSIGIYSLRITYSGNVCFLSTTLEVNLEVVASPPQITPQLSVILEKSTVVPFEFLTVELQAQNAYAGSSIVIQVYVNGTYNSTFILFDGLGSFTWAAEQVGLYNLTFLVVEDALYFKTSVMVIIEVIENEPPELLGYSFEDILFVGDPFVIEAAFYDESGIGSCWLTINGTRYDLEPIGTVYNGTVFDLEVGHYNLTLFVEDRQGYLAFYPVKQLLVIERKTQVVKYNLNTNILELGQDFNFEALIYSETTVEAVYLFLNGTKYQMTKLFENTQQLSGWSIVLKSLPLGTYWLAMQIVETNGAVTTGEIHDSLLVIPNRPTVSISWTVEQSEGSDYVSGLITIVSFYEIVNVSLWLDGQPIQVMKTTETTFTFEAYVAHAKSHILKVSVEDSKGNLLLEEFTKGGSAFPTVLLTSIVLSVLIFISLAITFFFLAAKRQKQGQITDQSSMVLDIPEIELEEEASVEEEIEEGLDQVADSSEVVEEEEEKEEEKEPVAEQNKSPSTKKKRKSKAAVAAVSACVLLPEGDLVVPEISTQAIPLPSEPLLAEVKEYVATVKEDGLIQTPENGSNGNGRKSIQDLSTLSVEIDQRLLPKKEQKQREQEEARLKNPAVLSLKEIAEEIEETFSNKREKN